MQAARQSRDANNRKHIVSRVPTLGSPKGTIVLNSKEQRSEDKLDNEQPLTFPFLDALRRLDALARTQRLSVCDNETCPAPYFIANRKSQRFCTEACAGPANR